MSWSAGGRSVRVGKAIAWPAKAPLVQVGRARSLLEERGRPKSIKSLVNTYENCLTGGEVLECIAEDKEQLAVMEEHAALLLDFLETCNVIVRVNKTQGIFHKKNDRLYRIVIDNSCSTSGVLAVNIASASGLIAQNIAGWSNPVAVLSFGDQTCTTKVIEKDLNPSWNEIFLFPMFACESGSTVADLQPLKLSVTVYTHRSSKPKVAIGATSPIDFNEVPKSATDSVAMSTIMLPLGPPPKAGRGIILAARNFVNHGLKADSESIEDAVESVKDKDSDFIMKFAKQGGQELASSEDESDETEKRGYKRGSLLLKAVVMNHNIERDDSTGSGTARSFMSALRESLKTKANLSPSRNDEAKKISSMHRLTKRFTSSTKTASSPRALGGARDVTQVTRDVKYNAERKDTQVLIGHKLAELKSWLENAGSRSPQPLNFPVPSSAALEGEDDSSPEVKQGLPCILFADPDRAFGFLSGGTESISLSAWVRLAPLLSPLCTELNAHDVYEHLLFVQSRANKMFGVGTSILEGVQEPVFREYVSKLYAACHELAVQKAVTDRDFGLRESGRELVVRVVDRVRGGRETESGVRKGTHGGKLILTTKAVYYAKRHTFHKNELSREDLENAVQVLESNGTMDFGLMIGFKGPAGGGASEPHEQEAHLPADELDEDRLEEGDFLLGRLQRNSLGSFSDPDDSEDDEQGGEEENDDAAKVASAATTGAGKFELKADAPSTARYSVFRFPSQNEVSSRDCNILILRQVIAANKFCNSVLHVLGQDIVQLVPLSDANAGNMSKSAFLDRASQHVRELAAQEILCLRAMLRMFHETKFARWEWLRFVDTFETFGDQWTWRKRTPLALLNLVCAALQPGSKRSAITRRAATESLLRLGLQVLAETAAICDVGIKWSPQPTAVSFSKISQCCTSSLTNEVRGRFQICPAVLGQTQLFLAAGPATELTYRGDSMLLRSLDDAWLDFSMARETTLVRSVTKMESMGQNVRLLKSILEPCKEAAHDLKAMVKQVITWQNPQQTVLLGASSLVLIWTGWTEYLIAAITASLLFGLVELRSIRQRSGFKKLYVPIKESKTLLQKYRDIKKKYSQARRAVQRLNMFLLKARALLTWQNPDVSLLLAFFLLVLVCIFAFAPRIFYELALWVYFFTKKFRSGRTSARIKRFIGEQWDKVPPSPVFESVTDNPVKMNHPESEELERAKTE